MISRFICHVAKIIRFMRIDFFSTVASQLLIDQTKTDSENLTTTTMTEASVTRPANARKVLQTKDIPKREMIQCREEEDSINRFER